METKAPAIKRIIFAACGVALAAPSLFFAYYTARLIYLNMTMEDAAAGLKNQKRPEQRLGFHPIAAMILFRT